MPVETRVGRLHRDSGACGSRVHVRSGEAEERRSSRAADKERDCLVARNITTEPVVQAVSQKACDLG